ncbi:hypothetical protein scyTo_0000023 [Scyliorhinus torazame]|uniref:LNR domain-containing protein n=1 Tax=Scyliorhinus torazame TaxID=75743 RepID=A0A401NN42_SCYTO|nr:hypothetical protein [Scyliorhinus torazame]
MCEAVPAKFHGFYQCTNGFQFNSACWVNCSDANNQTESINNLIRCRKDGTWNGSLQICSSMKGDCQLPHRLNSQIRLSCKDGYSIGAECTPSCLSHQNDPVILPSNMTSDDVKYWMSPPKAKNIVCTAGLNWYPHPEMIHCIKSCEPFVGDNYCDGNNNRAYCSYDGGDCCPSTVITKKVIPFPMSCELHGDCACRDPAAQEHGKETDQEETRYERRQEESRYNRDQEECRYDRDQGECKYNRDQEECRYDTDQEESRYNTNQEESRYDTDQEESRYDTDQEESRYDTNQEESRYDTDQEESRYDTDQGECRYNRDKEECRYNTDQEESRYDTDQEESRYDTDQEESRYDTDQEECRYDTDQEENRFDRNQEESSLRLGKLIRQNSPFLRLRFYAKAFICPSEFSYLSLLQSKF